MDPQQSTEDSKKSFVARNFIALAIIAALLLIGIGFLLYQLSFRPPSPTIPPIIIKSVEGDSPPIDIETPTGLEGPVSLAESANTADLRKLYKYSGVGPIKYVKIERSNSATSSTPDEYRDNNGLVVKMWIQYQDDNNKQWYYEANGPHLTMDGTREFQLTCDTLTPEKPIHGNPPKRKFKRSLYSPNRPWRIGRVQVGNKAPVEINNYTTMVISFDEQ